MSQPDRIDTYLAGVGAITEAIRDLTPDQLRARPVAGMWSMLELVCHLADADALFADRMKRVLSEDRPTLLFADPERYSTTLAYQVRDASEEVAFIAALRRQMARILRAQPLEAWQRVGVHSQEGERTLQQLLGKAIDHLDHHLTFLRAKRLALEGGADRPLS